MTVAELKKELEFCQDAWNVYIEGVGRKQTTNVTELIIETRNDHSIVILTDYSHEKTPSS